VLGVSGVIQWGSKGSLCGLVWDQLRNGEWEDSGVYGMNGVVRSMDRSSVLIPGVLRDWLYGIRTWSGNGVHLL